VAAEALKLLYPEQGLAIRLGVKTKSLHKSASGVVVEFDDADGAQQLECDKLLVAAGVSRIPPTSMRWWSASSAMRAASSKSTTSAAPTAECVCDRRLRAWPDAGAQGSDEAWRWPNASPASGRRLTTTQSRR